MNQVFIFNMADVNKRLLLSDDDLDILIFLSSINNIYCFSIRENYI